MACDFDVSALRGVPDELSHEGGRLSFDREQLSADTAGGRLRSQKGRFAWCIVWPRHVKAMREPLTPHHSRIVSADDFCGIGEPNPLPGGADGHTDVRAGGLAVRGPPAVEVLHLGPQPARSALFHRVGGDVVVRP